MLLPLIVVASCLEGAAPKANLFQRSCRDRSCSSQSGRGAGVVPVGPPLFSFEPTGTACSGAAVTGSTGEVITFTRASSASCLKHGETSGIANGDMVILSTDQPALQPGGSGSGALGLRVWGGRTNWTAKSQKLDDALWTSFGTFPPTVTANYGVAPDGTQTAERVTIHAVTAGNTQSSFVYQSGACDAGTDSYSFFVRGLCPDAGFTCPDAGWGRTDLAINDGAAGWISKTCDFVSESWSRCVMESVPITSTGINMLVAIGATTINDGLGRDTADILAWGAQCEVGASVSPYIPTDTGFVTRAVEKATTPYTAAGSGLSFAATYTPLSRTIDDSIHASMSFNASNETVLGGIGAKNKCNFTIAGAQTYSNAPGNFLTPAETSASCSYASSSRTLCGDAYCKAVSGALTLPSGSATIYIGGQRDGGAANGTVKSICADPSSSRCQRGVPLCTPPSDEPHVVAAIGDSIMVGAFEVKVLDELNDRLCPRGLGAVSFAESGAGVAGQTPPPNDCVTQYHTSVKGHSYRAVLTNCGVNELNNGGSVAVGWPKMESLLNDITRDGGFHVVLGNVTACHGYSGCNETDIITYNAHEADWCADAGSRATCIDNYVLLSSGSRDVIFSPTRDTTLGNQCLPSSDALHPNNFCTTRLADAFADAVQ